ncbi:MAG: UPF0175 family protein [Bryobacterales bacterium]
MTIQVELPADISAALEKSGGDVSRRFLEALAIEGFRKRELTRSQVRRMLGFETSVQVDAFMKQAGVPFPYDVQDLRADFETLKELGNLPAE